MKKSYSSEHIAFLKREKRSAVIVRAARIALLALILGVWELIAAPARGWLEGRTDRDALVAAIRQADRECGSCGCELDPLYKRALALLGA